MSWCNPSVLRLRQVVIHWVSDAFHQSTQRECRLRASQEPPNFQVNHGEEPFLTASSGTATGITVGSERPIFEFRMHASTSGHPSPRFLFLNFAPHRSVLTSITESWRLPPPPGFHRQARISRTPKVPCHRCFKFPFKDSLSFHISLLQNRIQPIRCCRTNTRQFPQTEEK